jgi:hypothetical protein
MFMTKIHDENDENCCINTFQMLSINNELVMEFI